MATHTAFMQEVVKRPIQIVKDSVRDDRHLLNDFDNKENPKRLKELKVVAHVLNEQIILKGNSKGVLRVFVKTADSGEYETVGWIVLDCVYQCMICQISLETKESKKTCYACGNVLCEQCCSQYAPVREIEELGDVPVCVQCYFGQNVVHAARNENLTFKGSKHQEIAPKARSRSINPSVVIPPPLIINESIDTDQSGNRKRFASDSADYRAAGGNSSLLARSLNQAAGGGNRSRRGSSDNNSPRAGSPWDSRASSPRLSLAILNRKKITETETISFIPEPGFVIKTDNNEVRGASEKIFINVWQHDRAEQSLYPTLKPEYMPTVLFGPESFALDKQGNATLVFNVAIAKEHFPFVTCHAAVPSYLDSKTFADEAILADKERKKVTDDVIVREIILAADKHFKKAFDSRNFVLPRVNCGYKGAMFEEATDFSYQYEKTILLDGVQPSGATPRENYNYNYNSEDVTEPLSTDAVAGTPRAGGAQDSRRPSYDTWQRDMLNDYVNLHGGESTAEGNRSRLDSSDTHSQVSDTTMDYSVMSHHLNSNIMPSAVQIFDSHPPSANTSPRARVTPDGTAVQAAADTVQVPPPPPLEMRSDSVRSDMTSSTNPTAGKLSASNSRRGSLLGNLLGGGGGGGGSGDSESSEIGGNKSKRASIFGMAHNPFAHHSDNNGAGSGDDKLAAGGSHYDVTKDMLMYKPNVNVSQDESNKLKLASMNDPKVLVGWQVALADDKSRSVNIYVITALKKNHLRKTEFKLSNAKTDHWTKLKRSAKKSGANFKPTRKVMFLDAVPISHRDGTTSIVNHSSVPLSADRVAELTSIAEQASLVESSNTDEAADQGLFRDKQQRMNSSTEVGGDLTGVGGGGGRTSHVQSHSRSNSLGMALFKPIEEGDNEEDDEGASANIAARQILKSMSAAEGEGEGEGMN